MEVKQDSPAKDKSKIYNDSYLESNIVGARNNKEKLCDIYRNYVGQAETFEERKRRINNFRCGGW